MPIGLLSNADVWSDRHKAVAFYFDRMALAVPPEWSEERVNEPRTAVKELTDRELLTIMTYRDADHDAAAEPIIAAVNEWPDQIQAAIEIVDWQPRTGQRGTLREHWFSMRLAECLEDAGLGYTKLDIESGQPFLRTSARLIQIYESRLAEVVASRTGFSLTGADHAPFPGAALWGPETIRDVLVAGRFDGLTKFHDSTAQAGLGLVSVRAVLPSDVRSLTIKQVADFRHRNRAALSVFQDFIEAAASSRDLKEALSNPVDAEAAGVHLQAEYERTVLPEIGTLEQSLKRMGIATVWRTMSISIAAPVVVAEGIRTALPDSSTAKVVVSGSGIALALGKLLYDARIERSVTALRSPVSYLLSLQREDWTKSIERHQHYGPLVRE